MARNEKYIRMQQIMDESAAYIWITNGTFVYGHANSVKARNPARRSGLAAAPLCVGLIAACRGWDSLAAN